jgi:hypothetical protein
MIWAQLLVLTTCSCLPVASPACPDLYSMCPAYPSRRADASTSHAVKASAPSPAAPKHKRTRRGCRGGRRHNRAAKRERAAAQAAAAQAVAVAEPAPAPSSSPSPPPYPGSDDGQVELCEARLSSHSSTSTSTPTPAPTTNPFKTYIMGHLTSLPQNAIHKYYRTLGAGGFGTAYAARVELAPGDVRPMVVKSVNVGLAAGSLYSRAGLADRTVRALLLLHCP